MRDQRPWLLVDTAQLVLGVVGEFGGPVVAHASAAAFRRNGEFEAPDTYNIELRLRQTGGPRVDPATGADVEQLAAAVVFQALTGSTDLALIHVHDDDALLSAALPGAGTITFPPGTTIYDWDADEWGGFVLRPAAGR
ncbi:hypothetical protein DMB66_41965 [Actinoplanes sp. ATCC 53533]|nr:hypothetical protein DMB66_41965 [Actinoplanes sp. ATCC 53533]